MRQLSRVLIAFSLIVALASCSDDDNGAVDPDDTTTTTVDPDDTTTTEADSSAPPDEAWETVTEPETGLSASLPGTPEVIDQEVPWPEDGTVRAIAHLVEDGEAAWSFSIFLPPSGAADLMAMLEGAADGMGGVLVEYSETTVGESPAMDGEVSFASEGIDGTGFVRVFRIDGRAVVQLQAVGLASEREMLEETFERLVNSFEQ